jgi:hypothetical protein
MNPTFAFSAAAKPPLHPVPPLCTFLRRAGGCTKGAACPFTHAGKPTKGNPTGARPAPGASVAASPPQARATVSGATGAACAGIPRFAPQPTTVFGHATPPVSLFAQQTAQDAFGKSTSHIAGPFFGQPASPASSLFEQPSTNAAKLFGQLATPASSLFGQPTAQTANPYGQSATTESSFFGQPAAPATKPFGKLVSQTSSLFGQPAAQAASPSWQWASPASSLFGQPAAQAANPFGKQVGLASWMV